MCGKLFNCKYLYFVNISNKHISKYLYHISSKGKSHNNYTMKNLLYQTDIRFKNITSTSAQLYKQDVNKFEILKKHITGRNVNIFSQMKNNSGNTHFQIANYKRLSLETKMIQNRTFSTIRKLTDDEVSRNEIDEMTETFLTRTHRCNNLTDDIVGKEIKLCGWVEKDIKDNRFLTFNDGFGSVQLIIPDKEKNKILKTTETLDSKKCVVQIIGTVRSKQHINSYSESKSIEMVLKTLTFINSVQYTDLQLPEINESNLQNLQNNNTILNADTKINCITNDSNKKIIDTEYINEYTTRSHTCGELRSTDVGKEVILCGWVEYIRMNKFILLRDKYGSIQIMINKLSGDHSELINLHLESVICVKGVVCLRPHSQIAKHLTTGEIEVSATTINIINKALAKLPFHIRNYNKANEKILNRYRFLALRFPELQNNLRLRSEMLFKIREFLIKKKHFVEVETPTLFKKTPGGAQEFIVPTHFKNKFYSLVQSPQQLKQLLMVGSLDRYFQIARCYRDERTNSERQPEFTQLDIELSFTNMENVMKLTEDVLLASWPKNKNPITVPFPRISYKYAIENYGSDKPCFLDKFLIQNIEMCIESNNKIPAYMYVIPNGKSLYNKLVLRFDALINDNDVRIYTIQVPTIEKFNQSIEKIFPGFQNINLKNIVTIKADDLVVLAVGSKKLKTLKILGQCRHETIDVLNLIEQLNEKGIYEFFWVIDFPLFEENKEGEITSAHHPFTQPHPEDINLIFEKATKARALAYDLILNGSEIGGGSIRIHDSHLQKSILKFLGLAEQDFSHLLQALEMGCPPHGGIALGLDRLIAILCNRNSIKDVIAFPKGTDGQDFMTGCPNDIPLVDKIRYHLHTPGNSNSSPCLKEASDNLINN